MKRLLVISVIVALACTALSCKGGPEAKPDEAQTDARPRAVAMDGGLQRALADQPGVVVKLRLDRVDRIAPALDTLATQMEGPDKKLLGSIVSRDWPSLFSMMTRSEAPETLGIDESSPVYVAMSTIRGERFGEAFAYGAPLQPDEALPVALRTRVVTRASNPDALEAAFEQTRAIATREDYTLSLSRDGDYVVADYVRVRPGLDSFMDVEGESARPRPTPAYREFKESSDPLVAYFRTSEALAYGAAANQYDMSAALESASPMHTRRIVATTIAANLNLSLLSSPSQRELEDTCIRLTGNGETAAMLTGLGTQTELGRALAAANHKPAMLPESFGDDVDTLAELRVNVAGDAMWEAAPVESEVMESSLGGVNQMARTLRGTGWPGYVAVFFGSPTYVPRMMYGATQQSDRAAMPYAMLLEVLTENTSNDTPATRAGGQFPTYGAAMAFALEKLEDQQMDEVRDAFEEFPAPGGVKMNTTKRDDSTLVRATNGDALAEDTATVELAAGRLWGTLDLAGLLDLMGQPESAGQLAPFDTLTADLILRETTNRWRLVIGEAGMIVESIPESNVAPRPAAPGCVGTAIARRSQLFKGLEMLNTAEMSPDEWLALFEKSGVDSATTECADAHPNYAESLEIALARTGEIMVRFAQILGKPDVVEALRQRGCDLGDEIQCNMLNK